MLRELAKEHVRNHESEDGIAEKLHRLVVEDAAAGIFVHARTVRQGVFQQPAIPEPVADTALERLELRSERHDARRPGLVAMAVDDLPGVGAVLGLDGNPQLAQGQRKRRARQVGRNHRADPVRLEQPADHLRLALRRRAKDDDQVRKMRWHRVSAGVSRARHTASRPADANV